MTKHVESFAKGLSEVKFGPGKKLVVWTRDCAEGVVAQLGALRLGCHVVCLGSNSTKEDFANAMVGAR